MATLEDDNYPSAGDPKAASVPPSGLSGSAPLKLPLNERKLHRGHFAFMRAVVQGLDTRTSWDRYLRAEGGHDDGVGVKRTIRWIRDEFAAAARRSARPGTARLVQIDTSRIPDNAAQYPTLDDFIAEHGLEDFSQAEQLDEYHARYGTATQRQSRRRRLVEKQLDALNWLEKLVAQPPRPDDALASWLHPDLAVRLEAAGIRTVAALVDRVNGIGHRWYSGIRAIGTSKAQRILEWLRAHEAAIGMTIGAHVDTKRSSLTRQDLDQVVPVQTGVVPLEKLVVPPELDGSAGLYRAPRGQCRLNADDDLTAILAWVRAKRGLNPEQRAALKRRQGLEPNAPEAPLDWLRYLSHTQRAYLKEAERYLLWAVVQHKKSLSSMTKDDCDAYCGFLANPVPAKVWCGPRGREKWSALWRPFEGPLSARAQLHAISVLKSLFQFLVDHRYVTDNPWRSVHLSGATARIDKERSFTHAQWAFLKAEAGLLPPTSANLRLRFALNFFYETGLRLKEGVCATVDHLEPRSPAVAAHASYEGRVLSVYTAGDGRRQVIFPDSLVQELSTYLVSRGLDADPAHPRNRGAYLLAKAVDISKQAPWSPSSIRQADGVSGITAVTLYQQMKRFFSSCARVLASTDRDGARRFAAASTHWLRHTQGMHAAAAGTPIHVLQQKLGHASCKTTAVYSAIDNAQC